MNRLGSAKHIAFAFVSMIEREYRSDNMPPDYYTVANVPSDWTQQKEQDHISKAEKKIKKVLEESKKKSSKEDSSPREMFEYAYPFHCVKSGQR
jgi:hypothetical protein